MVIQLSIEKLKRFGQLIRKKDGVEEKDLPDYLKWIQYYLDFVHKYGFDKAKKDSLRAFVEKLAKKRQSSFQRNQASHSVELYQKHLKSYEAPGTSAGEKRTEAADWESALEKLGDEIAVRQLSPCTLKSYRGWVTKFRLFCSSKELGDISEADVKKYLTWLAVKRQVAASTQNLAFNALLFFFTHVLNRPYQNLKDTPRAKRIKHVPAILTKDQIFGIIKYLSDPFDLLIKIIYGCGLRLNEAMGLRVQDIDLGNGVLMVRQGEGKKDRKIPLPVSIISQLENQINRVRNIFDDDLKVKFQGAFVPKEIGSKSKNAGKKWIWQFFFPGASLVFVKGECALKRYHLHDTALQKAFQKAVALDKIPKRVTIHSGIVMPPISYSWDLISGPYRSCWGMGIFAHNVAFSRAVYRFAKQRFVGNHLYCATLAIIASASFREEKLVIT